MILEQFFILLIKGWLKSIELVFADRVNGFHRQRDVLREACCFLDDRSNRYITQRDMTYNKQRNGIITKNGMRMRKI